VFDGSVHTLILSLSPFDVAQGDPEALEGSKDEPFCSWFDELTTSDGMKATGQG
jgi:hypothetical protein